MNIIQERQDRRERQINSIMANIKKVKELGGTVVEEGLILEVMSVLNLSRRTAREYIKIANFRLNPNSNMGQLTLHDA